MTKKAKFILLDKDGEVVDKYGVENVPEAIADTFKELIRLYGRRPRITYEQTWR